MIEPFIAQKSMATNYGGIEIMVSKDETKVDFRYINGKYGALEDIFTAELQTDQEGDWYFMHARQIYYLNDFVTRTQPKDK